MDADELRVEPCGNECRWRLTDRTFRGEPIVACVACASEWVPSDPFTPYDADGSLSRDIQKLRQR